MPRITLRTALPFLAGGLLSLLGPLPAKEASASYLVIPSPEVAEASAAYKYANMTEAEALAELDKRKVPYKRADPIPGVTTPVRLTGKLHGVHIHSSIPESQRATSIYEVLDARLALALDDFAKILERHDIEEVVHYSLYRPNVAREGHGLKDGLHAGHAHEGEGATKVASADVKAGATASAGASASTKGGTAAGGTAGASAAGAKPGAAGKGAIEAVSKGSAGAKPGGAGKAGAAVPGVGAVAAKGSPGQKPASAGKGAGQATATKGAGAPAAATKPAPKAGAALPKLPAAGKALPSPGAKGSAAPSGAKQKTPAPGAAEKPAAAKGAQGDKPVAAKGAPSEKPATVKVAQSAAPGGKRVDRGQVAAPKAGAKGAGSTAAAKASVSKAGAGGAPAAVSASKGGPGGAAISASKGGPGGAAVSASKGGPGGAAMSGSKAAPGAKPGAVTAVAVTGAGAKGGVTTAAVAETKAGSVTTAVTKPVSRQTWAPPGTRHPAGLAIDVAMLKKRDGQWISVARHFQGKIGAKTCGDGVRTADTPEARELRSIVCEANDLGVFTYVLTPNFNAAHFDHFHMEIKPTVKWFLYH